jgi:hypothetical protein
MILMSTENNTDMTNMYDELFVRFNHDLFAQLALIRHYTGRIISLRKQNKLDDSELGVILEGLEKGVDKAAVVSENFLRELHGIQHKKET